MIRIERASPLVTVQDLGRFGHLAQGVPRAGAADRGSLIAGNVALGNRPGEAGIEIPLSACSLVFERASAVALTGADCRAMLDSRPLPTWSLFAALPGQRLQIEPGREGVFTYLTFAGGVAVPEVLGSRSTQLRGGFGGQRGRGLRGGDLLPLGEAPVRSPAPQRIPRPPRVPSAPIRVIPAAEYEALDPSSRHDLWTAGWTITSQSSRAGLRLLGPTLRLSGVGELRSHGIVPGVIQLPSGGAPIIQMSDAATMGGYPKIGTVIDGDLDRLAQMRPGSTIRFQEVGLAEAACPRDAERLWREGLLRASRQGGSPGARDELGAEILAIAAGMAHLGESGISFDYSRNRGSYRIVVRKA